MNVFYRLSLVFAGISFVFIAAGQILSEGWMFAAFPTVCLAVWLDHKGAEFSEMEFFSRGKK